MDTPIRSYSPTFCIVSAKPTVSAEKRSVGRVVSLERILGVRTFDDTWHV